MICKQLWDKKYDNFVEMLYLSYNENQLYILYKDQRRIKNLEHLENPRWSFFASYLTAKSW